MGRLFAKHYDAAIDLFGNPRSAQLILASGAKIRIGGDFRGRRIFYTHKIKDDGRKKSAIDFHLQYLKPLNIIIPPARTLLHVTKSEEEWAQNYLERKGYDLSQPVIGIHPGASWPAKRWFANRFSVLANKLAKQENVQIYFTMGPGEEELVDDVIRACNFSIVRPAILNFRQLAAVIKLFKVYVSNDCGPMHIAPAVGTKVVGIFGPGEPEIWFPYSAEDGHQLVYHQIDCSRCHRDLCENLFCMQAITVDHAYQAVLKSLYHEKAS